MSTHRLFWEDIFLAAITGVCTGSDALEPGKVDDSAIKVVDFAIKVADEAVRRGYASTKVRLP